MANLKSRQQSIGHATIDDNRSKGYVHHHQNGDGVGTSAVASGHHDNNVMASIAIAMEYSTIDAAAAASATNRGNVAKISSGENPPPGIKILTSEVNELASSLATTKKN